MSPTEPRPDAARARREAARPRARAVPAPAPLTRGVAVVVALLLALAGVLLSAGRADAHNALLGTDPADGSTVETPPTAITLTFDQPAQALGTEVVVLGPDGATVSTGDAQLVDSTVVQALTSDLPAGAYSVQWRITSADGHPLSGELAFTASSGTAPAAPVEEPTEDAVAPTPEPEMTTQEIEPSPITETVAPEQELAEDEDAGIAAGTVAAIVVAVLAAAAVAVFVVRERRRSSDGRGDGAGPTDAGPDGSGDGRSAS